MQLAARISALSLVCITGCATTPEATTATLQQGCVKEVPTGSSVPVIRCRSEQEVAQDREAGRAATEEMIRPRTGKPSKKDQ